jgi:hypothetical protein
MPSAIFTHVTARTTAVVRRRLAIKKAPQNAGLFSERLFYPVIG